MRPLNRKLTRDLWHLRGQVIAVAAVIASGVAVLSMSLSTTEALGETARAYYERYRFAHVFGRVQRAPEYLADRIRLLPGVQSVSTRVVKTAILDVAGFEEPVIGQFASIPERGEPELNALALRTGRLPRPGHADEALLSEPFAEAHGLVPGSHLRAILNGHWRELEVVGLALSPEYVYTIGPGALMPDDQRFGVIWMGRKALQAAFDLDGAFNDISVGLLRGTDPDPVIREIDELLSDYGGAGAYERANQISNWFLMNEIKQLETMSSILPVLFLIVAAFLTNMVLSRLITVERAEIGLLKAFGYRNREIGMHYVKLTLAIAGIGIVLGWAAGYWFGLMNTRVYAEFYRFPFLLYEPGPNAFILAGAASLIAALLGTINTVRAVAALPPGEAMRPPAPTMFRQSLLARTRLFLALDQPTRILLRQIARWPLRSFVTSAGIGMAIGVLIVSIQWLDAIDRIADVYFLQAQHNDVTVGFAEARAADAEFNLAQLPGVITTEPMRTVATKIRFGSREERKMIRGVPPIQNLHHVYDADGHPINLPPDGLVISTMLGELLNVVPGDIVTVEALQGRRPTRRIPITGMFETYIGSPAYMDIAALNRFMGEGPTINSVHMRTDALQRPALFRELKEIPMISSLNLKAAAVQTFHDTMAESMLIFVSFFVVFACTLAFGVTYNAGRITLSERGRELATLRVLGFTRAEISYILLGEIGVLTLIALPLGCAIGYSLTLLISGAFKTELFRVPFAILPNTYGISLLIVLAATLASIFVVRRRLEHLDLIAVLKTRE
ncbi:MAG: FtsX-like permease family protein [Lentisphaeria bacterium]|nr:permease [Chromatiales bacterium]MDP6450505.1 FtsX-like permease family protein [Lentisphaeria bacterium]